MTQVLIASYLEPDCVERIRAEVPRVDVVYEPELLPRPRYRGDHDGHPLDLADAGRERWAELLKSADVMFDFDWDQPARMPARCPNLRWVQASSAGIGGVVAEAGLAGAPFAITTAAGVHAIPLAEFVVAGVLYLIKDFPRLELRKRERVWERFSGGELSGKSAAIIGLGAIGRHVGLTLHQLGVEVTGVSRRSGAGVPPGFRAVAPVSHLGDALDGVELLVVSCPLTAETRGLVGRRELGLLTTGAIVTNIGRGPVIDEQALLDALETGHLGGAVLDVFDQEPLPVDSRFWERPNVVVSPHSASTVAGENARLAGLFVENLRRFLDGDPLLNRYDPDRGY
ncbi:MAG TPA: D-2-hydroxyacid dehydrogenase [Streptosporangiaceae bacterium]